MRIIGRTVKTKELIIKNKQIWNTWLFRAFQILVAFLKAWYGLGTQRPSPSGSHSRWGPCSHEEDAIVQYWKKLMNRGLFFAVSDILKGKLICGGDWFSGPNVNCYPCTFRDNHSYKWLLMYLQNYFLFVCLIYSFLEKITKNQPKLRNHSDIPLIWDLE
jgi:hypothetical protein